MISTESETTLPLTTDPADVALFVLETMRRFNTGATLSYEAFVAASVAHHLSLVGSDFSDAEILRAVASYKRRSPHLFNGGAG